MNLPFLFCIPTVLPEREKQLSRLLSQLSQHGARDIFISTQDKDKKAEDNIKNMYSKCYSLARMSGIEWIIRLEDDVFLSPEFGQKVLDVIKFVEDDVKCITFYSNSKYDNVDGLRRIKNVKTRYGDLCLAIRADILHGLSEYYRTFREANPQHKDADDLCFSWYLHSIKAKTLVYTPSQVQHLDEGSLLNHKFGKRQSQSFTKKYGILENLGYTK